MGIDGGEDDPQAADETQAGALTGDERTVAAAWFSHMDPGGSLSFGMKEFVPTERASAALDALVRKGLLLKSDKGGGAVDFRPLADFSPLRAWLIDNLRADDSFPLVEKVGEGEGKAVLTLSDAAGAVAEAVGKDTFQRIMALEGDDFVRFMELAKNEGLAPAEALERVLSRRDMEPE